MCAVSMISDHYLDKWTPQPQTYFTKPLSIVDQWARLEIEELKKQLAATKKSHEKLVEEFEEFKQLLKRAKEYDEKTDQHHCENQDKINMLKRIAEAIGVEFDEKLLK